MNFSNFRTATLACVAGIAAACGSGIAGDDYKSDPVAVIRGQVTNEAALASPSDIRAALLWIGDWNAAGAPFIVTQETPVNAEFPSSFELVVDGIPPESVMNTDSEIPNNRFAFASVVIYADENGNGRLDLPASGFDPLPETILGTRNDLWISYIEGPPAPLDAENPDWLVAPTGFSAWQMPTDTQWDAAFDACEQAHPAYDDAFDACLEQAELTLAPQINSLDTIIEIPLSTEPSLPEAVCFGFYDESDPGPDEVEIVCDADGRGYSVELTGPAVEPGTALALCMADGGIGDSGAGERLADGEPIPDGWPCSG